MRKAVLMIGMLLLSSIAAFSQINNWENVKSLRSDQRIVVENSQGKKIRGKFQSAGEDKLSLSKDGKIVEIAMSDVKRLYLGKKGTNHLGGVIGGVAGFLVGGVIATSVYNQGDRQGDGLDGLAGAVPGAVGGAIVGRKIGGGTKQKELIYAVD